MRISWIVTLFFGSMLRVTAQHSIAYVDDNRSEWKRDLVKIEAPAYPAVAKRWHVQGAGRFRVSIDTNTGRVTDVSVLKSTGYGVLDGSAISRDQNVALETWQISDGRCANNFQTGSALGHRTISRRFASPPVSILRRLRSAFSIKSHLNTVCRNRADLKNEEKRGQRLQGTKVVDVYGNT